MEPPPPSPRNALVTGGGTGTGRAIAATLAEAGFDVRIAGRRQSKLVETAALHPDRIEVCVCDITDRDQIPTLLTGRDRLDILVNCAGINIPDRRMEVLDPSDWDHVLDVNVTGTFNVLYHALPLMRRQQDGLVVNISSVAGKRAIELAGVAYNASKFAMTALGTSIGLEEADNGIRVTNIYPGEINTPILDQRPVPVSEEHKARILQPADIAEVVLMLTRLPARAHIPELVMKPLSQHYA